MDLKRLSIFSKPRYKAPSRVEVSELEQMLFTLAVEKRGDEWERLKVLRDVFHSQFEFSIEMWVSLENRFDKESLQEAFQLTLQQFHFFWNGLALRPTPQYLGLLHSVIRDDGFVGQLQLKLVNHFKLYFYPPSNFFKMVQSTSFSYKDLELYIKQNKGKAGEFGYGTFVTPDGNHFVETPVHLLVGGFGVLESHPVKKQDLNIRLIRKLKKTGFPIHLQDELGHVPKDIIEPWDDKLKQYFKWQ